MRWVGKKNLTPYLGWTQRLNGHERTQSDVNLMMGKTTQLLSTVTSSLGKDFQVTEALKKLKI